jgi:hypothetical protein
MDISFLVNLMQLELIMVLMQVFYPYQLVIKVLIEVQVIRIYHHHQLVINRCHHQQMYQLMKMIIQHLLLKFIEVINRLNIFPYIK